MLLLYLIIIVVVQQSSTDSLLSSILEVMSLNTSRTVFKLEFDWTDENYKQQRIEHNEIDHITILITQRMKIITNGETAQANRITHSLTAGPI